MVPKSLRRDYILSGNLKVVHKHRVVEVVHRVVDSGAQVCGSGAQGCGVIGILPLLFFNMNLKGQSKRAPEVLYF